ncbi:MAG: 3-hydroxyacyl-ACP dehydratase FabZ [Candidatus Omnitrophica bacterium]|nr:3-hydroxyacyl-ACP dehydratase FabZ [Candidatus Omnitrophota bacterium]
MRCDKEKIKSILPQREPFLFIDEVIETQADEKVVAVKYIRPDEDFFRGHFPGNPIMPGVLIVEAMAQTAIVLYSLCKPEIAANHPNYYLGRVRAEFKAPVFPQDKLILEAHKVKIMDTAGVVDIVARVEDKVVAQATLTFGIKPKK